VRKKLQFEDSFQIWKDKTSIITLSESLKMADENTNAQFIYDPLGMSNSDSWYWCASVLDMLEESHLIHSFKIMKQAPNEQQKIAKPVKGRIY